MNKKEILDIIKDIKEKIKVYFVVDTLKYLEKGGRIGKARAFLGSILNIKPILTLEEGVVAPVKKVRGSSKAIRNMIKEIAKHIKKDDVVLKAAIMHSNHKQGALDLKQKIQTKFNVEEIIIADLGSVIGTYTGPKTLAVTFYSVN